MEYWNYLFLQYAVGIYLWTLVPQVARARFEMFCILFSITPILQYSRSKLSHIISCGRSLCIFKIAIQKKLQMGV